MSSIWRATIVCFGVPALVALAKLPSSPFAPAAWRFVSLVGLPPSEQGRVEDILLVPLAALVVAVARLVFGVRVLSLFRPILLVLAFRMTGIVPGVIFLCVVLAVIVALRPVWSKNPYYARVPFLLAAVAVPLVVVELGAAREHLRWIEPLAAFPIIALGLTCEGFVRVLRERDVAEAMRQTIAAVVLAVGIVLIVSTLPILPLLIRFPELLMADAGVVLLLSRIIEGRAQDAPGARRIDVPRAVAEPLS